MTISDSYKFKSAIVITPERMREMEALIINYYPNVSYSATLINKSKIDFNDLEELLSFNNGLKQKLKNITIYSILNNHKVLTINFKVHLHWIVNYDYATEIDFELDDTDKKILFSEKIKTILIEMKAPYSIISKFSLAQIPIIFTVLFFFCLIFGFANIIISATDTSASYLLGRNIGALLGILSVFVVLGFNKLWRMIFPPIVFLWGGQINNNAKLVSFRKNLFWGVIVAAIIGVIINYIF